MTDDIFGLRTNWIKEFGLELDKLNLKIRYKCLSRPDLLLKGDTISHLKNSGCETIWIGAESGSQKILDAMDKGTNVNQIYETAGKIHNSGMQIAFFIQFGYSGENWKDILLTREMIRRCLPEDIGISVSYPLPGTIFYERIKEQVRDKTNWQDSDDLDPLFISTYERGFYKILHRLVHSEYRLVKSIRQKNRLKILSFIFNAIKFIFFRIKISPYLFKQNSLYFTKT
jgi:anaerobic magnesium-protoporphyrin IX monomethyl ester cyclase